MSGANTTSLPSPRRLSHPAGWVFYPCRTDPERLIVFVHGFLGRPVGTWEHFEQSGSAGAWWATSDLLFVGYEWGRDTITAVAARIRRELPQFYPEVRQDLLDVGGASVRESAVGRYRELLLVGHSLGGVVLRRVLADAAQEWVDACGVDAAAPAPALLDARLRLFSPASAGVRLAGWPAVIDATSLGTAARLLFGRAASFADLQQGSPHLESTQQRTEALVAAHGTAVAALKANILWANPENIVLSERYDSDYVDHTQDGTNHRTVCKPNPGYVVPRIFVETGAP